jgi:hypothetical protein
MKHATRVHLPYWLTLLARLTECQEEHSFLIILGTREKISAPVIFLLSDLGTSRHRAERRGEAPPNNAGITMQSGCFREQQTEFNSSLASTRPALPGSDGSGTPTRFTGQQPVCAPVKGRILLI